MFLIVTGNFNPYEIAESVKATMAGKSFDKFKNIVFCCISTGTYKFPRDLASKIAITTVRDWLKQHGYPIKVVFCVYSDFDMKLYVEEFSELNLI